MFPVTGSPSALLWYVFCSCTWLLCKGNVPPLTKYCLLLFKNQGLSLKSEFIFNYKDFLWGNIILDKKTNYSPRRSSDDYSVLCSTSFEVLADDRHIIILNFPLLKNWAMLNNTVRFKSVTIKKKKERISQEIRMRWLTKEKSLINTRGETKTFSYLTKVL